MTAAVVRDHHVIPGAVLDLFKMRRAHFDIQAVVADEAHASDTRANINHPAAILIFQILLRGDNVALFSLGKVETH